MEDFPSEFSEYELPKIKVDNMAINNEAIISWLTIINGWFKFVWRLNTPKIIWAIKSNSIDNRYFQLLMKRFFLKIETPIIVKIERARGIANNLWESKIKQFLFKQN